MYKSESMDVLLAPSKSAKELLVPSPLLLLPAFKCVFLFGSGETVNDPSNCDLTTLLPESLTCSLRSRLEDDDNDEEEEEEDDNDEDEEEEEEEEEANFASP